MSTCAKFKRFSSDTSQTSIFWIRVRCASSTGGSSCSRLSNLTSKNNKRHWDRKSKKRISLHQTKSHWSLTRSRVVIQYLLRQLRRVRRWRSAVGYFRCRWPHLLLNQTLLKRILPHNRAKYSLSRRICRSREKHQALLLYEAIQPLAVNNSLSIKTVWNLLKKLEIRWKVDNAFLIQKMKILRQR